MSSPRQRSACRFKDMLRAPAGISPFGAYVRLAQLCAFVSLRLKPNDFHLTVQTRAEEPEMSYHDTLRVLKTRSYFKTFPLGWDRNLKVKERIRQCLC